VSEVRAFNLSGREVALAHDWLNGMRGGERCLELIAGEFPEATIYTLLWCPEALSEELRRHKTVVSGLSRVPGFTKHYRLFLPLFPWAIERFRVLEDTKLVISTSHCVAKGIRAPKGARHLCYCFTPMRYAWALADEYFGSRGLKRAVVDGMLARLRRWDAESAGRVDRFVAISEHVRKRIAAHYGREAGVVYPPADTGFFTPGRVEPGEVAAAAGVEESWVAGGYDLVVSALVPYKRIDLAVRAAEATGRRLVVAGAGGEEGKLRRLAGPNVRFAGRPGDEAIRTLYRGCRCLVFPGEEDFGIVPVEVQSCGKPVVAYGKGGALETVRDGVSGVFFGEQSAEALGAALEKASGTRWDAAEIRRGAERFGRERFLEGIRREIRAVMEGGRA
jgi:glycosyltransferase involved in cell wall biosynthesis